MVLDGKGAGRGGMGRGRKDAVGSKLRRVPSDRNGSQKTVFSNLDFYYSFQHNVL